MIALIVNISKYVIDLFVTHFQVYFLEGKLKFLNINHTCMVSIKLVKLLLEMEDLISAHGFN